ncbi:hypothetical protein ACET3Z_026391 [Daucus carota]
METSSSSSNSSSPDYITTRCIERERKALLVFKQGVVCRAGRHDFLHSWKNEDGDCCEWEGVGCNNHTGHVTRLHLSSLITPCYMNPTSVCISHSFLDLPYLKYLDISHNCFAEFPSYGLTADLNSGWLFNLSSLTYLDLSRINIVPHSIWVSVLQRIPSLSVMQLNFCNLSAPSSSSTNFSSSISSLRVWGNNINSSIFNWLSHFSVSLVELGLGDNLLKGRIPESLGHMTALTYLDLSGNQLNGVLPYSIRHLTNLQVIDFSANNFTGKLEDVLSGQFPLLQEVLVSENQLTGSLPDITLFSSLRILEASSNHLSGYLPPVFEHHSDLEILDLSNNHLRGSLPDFTGFLSLDSLDLSSNEFSGSLPHFTGLSSLRTLHLQKNYFSGTLPDLTGCSSLRVLRLSENQLTEWETQSTGLLSSLEVLDLSMNSIRSTINEGHLSNLSSLYNLGTSFNSLTFEFSSEWLPPFKLGVLSLVSYTIPTWLRNLSGVYHLNLSSNKIGGKFPLEFVYIQEIDLSSNYFDGPLPPILVECLKINLSQNKFSGTLLSMFVVKDSSLRFLDISHNHLFGPLPDNWMHFQGIVFLNLGYNNFSGRIPKSIGYLVFLQTLILRNNQLSGDLPVSIRNCSSLGFVDFGLNKLSGKVPSWIGEDLQQLYALILKSNRFYGGLPYETCHLSNLHFLDLSINRISGTIPACFGNFTAMIHNATEATEHIYSSYSDANVTTPIAIAPPSSYDLSNNNFSGRIPSGTQLQGFNISSYEGNIGLCGKPLKNICPEDEPADRVLPASPEYEVDGDDSEYKRSLYISAALGFSITFWGFIGTLVLNHRWRHAYFLLLFKLKERFYVALAVRVARLQRKA